MGKEITELQFVSLLSMPHRSLAAAFRMATANIVLEVDTRLLHALLTLGSSNTL